MGIIYYTTSYAGAGSFLHPSNTVGEDVAAALITVIPAIADIGNQLGPLAVGGAIVGAPMQSIA
jgi:hypothetical protein